MKKDNKGRITYLDLIPPPNPLPDWAITMGHSVCKTCGKDMPNVWDTFVLVAEQLIAMSTVQQ